MEGPPARGNGLYPLRRQISAARQVRLLHPLPNFAPVVQRTRTVGLHPTDAGSTPERRTIECRNSSKVEPAVDNREALVRFQHPAPFLFCSKRDWQRWQLHSTLNRDQAGSIPASPTKVCGIGRYGYALAF